MDRLILDMKTQIGLTEDSAILHNLIHSHWVNAQVFPDAHIFFQLCPVPIYIITNIGLSYMEQALQHNGLKAAGVVSADTVRAYKPYQEVFEEALRLSGCTPNQTVYIGDTYDTDIIGAKSAGIKPLLLFRGRVQQHNSVDAVNDLTQAMSLIFN